MPLTALDPHTALVVIDLQKGVLGAPTTPIDLGTVLHRTHGLADAFRFHGLPVVLVNVTGGAPGRTDASRLHAQARQRNNDWTELANELDAQRSDLRITKARWGAFHNTDLHPRLQQLDVTQIVLTGIATSLGVESTARQAHEHGYNVTLATDAMSDRDAGAHHNSITRIFPRLGETTTTAEILAELNATSHIPSQR